MNLRDELEKLYLPHMVCDDCWFSCPKSGDGNYCGDAPADRCNCGADEHNAILDRVLEANP